MQRDASAIGIQRRRAALLVPADYDLNSQFRYLRAIRRVTEDELKSPQRKATPSAFGAANGTPQRTVFRGAAPEFRILDWSSEAPWEGTSSADARARRAP
jgi:hypothetical protein